MNIVKKLTFRHLKENRSRTVVTILGICVSVAMITAVFVSIASFLNLMADMSVMRHGHKEADFYDVSAKQVEQLKADPRIKTLGRYGRDLPIKVPNGKGDAVAAGNMYIGDSENLSQVVICDYDGKLPASEKEIAVEREFLDNNELKLSVGDSITLQKGNYYAKTADGGECVTSYDGGGKFRAEGEETYKITAILHGNHPTLQTDRMYAIRGMSAAEKAGAVNASVSLARVDHNSVNELYSIISEAGVGAYDLSTDYLAAYLSFAEGSVAASLFPMVVIILIIIIIALVVLIYNSFAMSLSERVRYLGMLSSVGATRAQRRGLIYFEGVLLGAIGIPVGMLAGIGGIAVTLNLVGNKIVESGMLNGAEDLEMKTVVPLWSIVMILLFSALTIFISALIPSRKAAKITPIDAIRQNSEIRIKAKRLRTPRIVRAVFGYEGELSHKNLKRNGKKARVIMTSIALSVILFLSANYFCSMFIRANGYTAEIPYQVTVSGMVAEEEQLRAAVREADKDAEMFSIKTIYGRIGVSDANKEITATDTRTSTYRNLFDDGVFWYVYMVDDEDFNAVCQKSGVDPKPFYGGSEMKIALLNNISRRSGGQKVFTEGIIGKELKFNSKDSGDEDETVEKFKIGALVDFDDSGYMCRLSPQNTVLSFMPKSAYYARSGDEGITFGVVTANHKELYESLQNRAYTGEFTNAGMADICEQAQVVNTTVFVIQVFVYGFITLIMLITLANIINTVSTSISMRKKEFAMLKSVGMTARGFRKMACLESLFYGLRGLIFGLPVAALVSFAINHSVDADAIPFEIDFVLYIAVVLAVFVLVGITMLYAIHRQKKEPIIETLKTEIN